MVDDFDGRELLDTQGEKVGTIDRTYVDDDGNARMLSVKTGTILTSHRLVPADGLEETGDGIRTPYLKDVIEESPRFDEADTIEGETLAAVREYYAHDGDLTAQDDDTEESADTAMAPEEVAAVGEIDQRHRPPDDFPAVGQDTDVPAEFGKVRDLGDVVEVPIVEEVLVKKPVVREVLRIRKSHLTETGTAAADLRREEVEVVPTSRDLIADDTSTEK